MTTVKRDSSRVPFVIMALNTHDEASERALLEKWLIEHGYGECGTKNLIGCWKGEAERSWLITLPREIEKRKAAFRDLSELATVFEQDAILYSDSRRNSYLYWTARDDSRGEVEALGVFTEISKEVATSLDCFTFDPQQQKFWVTDARTVTADYPFCDAL